MLFGLKNAATTYQRAMIAIFHNMPYDCLKVMCGRRHRENKVGRLMIWDKCLEDTYYISSKWTLKCVFDVSYGNFLGLLYTETKSEAIQMMAPPITEKKSFVEEVPYVQMYILALIG